MDEKALAGYSEALEETRNDEWEAFRIAEEANDKAWEYLQSNRI